MKPASKLHLRAFLISDVVKFALALVAFALALISFPNDAAGASIGGNGIDPFERDTISVGSVDGLRGGAVVMPVNLFADETLGGVTLVFSFDPVALNLDSVSFQGTLGEPLDIRFINIDSTLGLIDGAAFSFDSAKVINPGSGVLANLHFTVSDLAVPGVYTIDTTTIDPVGPALLQTSLSTVQTDTTGNETVLPEFRAGTITVADRAATFDSVWVDTVIGAQGETVTLDVFLYNEIELAVIKIPLHYGSDKLIFVEEVFSGTRGILAGKSRTAQTNADSQQVFITLEFTDASPLSPGSGPIVRLRFTIDNTADDGTIPVDSASFLGFVGLELTSTVSDGSFGFIPIFHPGAIIVDLQTDVSDEGADNLGLPTKFELKQNYPNPFNPTTKIPFSLPSGSNVTLEVYNVLGQKVRTLLNERLRAGEHNIEFDGHNDNGASISSGIYFYRIKTDANTVTRKMTLLK